MGLLEGGPRVGVSLSRLVPGYHSIVYRSIVRVPEDSWLLNQLLRCQLLERLKLKGWLKLRLLFEEASTLKRSGFLLLSSGLFNRVNVEVFGGSRRVPVQSFQLAIQLLYLLFGSRDDLVANIFVDIDGDPTDDFLSLSECLGLLIKAIKDFLVGCLNGFVLLVAALTAFPGVDVSFSEMAPHNFGHQLRVIRADPSLKAIVVLFKSTQLGGK